MSTHPVTYEAEYLKDPRSVLDYTLSWVNWLAVGETIVTSSWTVPAGITKDSESNTTTTSTVWLSGGTDGQNYILTHSVTTNQGRSESRDVGIFCRLR